MGWLASHRAWAEAGCVAILEDQRQRGQGKRHVGKPEACYPSLESNHHGRGTKHSRGQKDSVSSCQPASVISHASADTISCA